MSKTIQRLLIFFLGVPAVIALVLFLPFRNHLFLNLATTVFSSLGALELSSMLERRRLCIGKIEAVILGALAPAAATAALFSEKLRFIVPLALMSGAAWILLSKIFSSREKLEDEENSVAGSVTAGFLTLVYPGVFLYWLVRMSSWQNSSIVILLFLMTVMGSDSTAWLTGMLFGKNNKGLFPASPNKSIAGFAGGIAAAIIVTAGFVFIVPHIYNSRFGIPVMASAIIVGFFTSAAAALGDLAESALKRSCSIKESGKIIPGRGGVLDSIDSICIAAPVFYLFFNVFFII